MKKSTITLAAIALAALGAQSPGPGYEARLRGETMSLDYDATSGESSLVVEAESEDSLKWAEIQSPSGVPIFKVRALRAPNIALSGFRVEARDVGSAPLFQTYPAGIYAMRARTTSGAMELGRAALSHQLPAAPVVTSPLDGAVSVPTNLSVTWTPDPSAVGWRVILEQDENDGLSLKLPAGSSSFQVPAGVLASGKETHLEVGAIESHGNCTHVQVTFTTL